MSTPPEPKAASSSLIRLPIASILAAIGSRLMIGLFLIFLARFAYLRVLSVSSKLVSEGLTHAIISVSLFPPSESCSSRVIFESRNGTWLPLRFSSPSALMTFPRASSPLLILMPSIMRAPTAPVRFSRSDPARSTKWNFEVITSSRVSALSSISICLVWLRIMLKMACDRDDVAFMFVDPVTRQAVPRSRQSSMASGVFTSASVAPKT
mmetsp:Transcript_2568/g.4731  ORF Transcript_2568/g.4731 Transcript_2568/m.4731 type:complete len:209 (-) Transcript_2568:737-1363(-)